MTKSILLSSLFPFILLISYNNVIGQDTVYLHNFYPDYDDLYTFGYGISSYQNKVAIASPGDDGFLGAAYIYDINGSGDIIYDERIVGIDTPYTEYFGGWHEGHAIDIFKKQLIVGADYNAQGACYIFEESSNNVWTQIQKLQPDELIDCDNFGSSVAINDSVAVSTAPLRENPFGSSRGSVFIFSKNPLTAKWEKDTVLYKPTAVGGAFGDWVSLKNNAELIISGIDNSSIFVYEKDSLNGQWDLIQTIDLTAYGVQPLSSCCRIDASDHYLVVSGIAYLFVFKKDNGHWNLDHSIFPTIEEIEGSFGYSVSITDKHLLVGAPLLNNESGTSFLYEKDSSGWQLTKVLLPIDSDEDKRMGEEVHIDGDYIIIGAPMEESGEGRVYYLNLSQSTGIQNSYKPISVKAFPNPSNEYIYFEGIPPECFINVYDRVGHEVLNAPILNNQKVNIKQLEPGLYKVIIKGKDPRVVFQSSFVKLDP